MTTAPYTTGPFVGSVSASMPTHTFGPSINIVSQPLVHQPLVHQPLVSQPLATRSEYTYESAEVIVRDCAEFHAFLKEQDRLDNLDILSKPVLTREKYIIPDDNFVSNCDEFDANLEYDIDGTGLKWVDTVFLSEVDTTKRIKYLNNYGEPVYAEDDDEEDDNEEDDEVLTEVLTEVLPTKRIKYFSYGEPVYAEDDDVDEEDEEDDDEEDDSRRRFVLFDERSRM